MHNNEIKRVTAKTDVFRLAVDDENGKELGILSFHVLDMNLIHRIQKGYNNIKDIILQGQQELEKIGYDEQAEELLDNEKYHEKINEIDQNLKAELNEMFDTDISEVFGNTNLLTPTVDGYLVMNILDAIIPALKDEMELRAKAAEKSYKSFKERH